MTKSITKSGKRAACKKKTFLTEGWEIGQEFLLRVGGLCQKILNYAFFSKTRSFFKYVPGVGDSGVLAVRGVGNLAKFFSPGTQFLHKPGDGR